MSEDYANSGLESAIHDTAYAHFCVILIATMNERDTYQLEPKLECNVERYEPCIGNVLNLLTQLSNESFWKLFRRNICYNIEWCRCDYKVIVFRDWGLKMNFLFLSSNNKQNIIR
jgi:hypothetical protein